MLVAVPVAFIAGISAFYFGSHRQIATVASTPTSTAVSRQVPTTAVTPSSSTSTTEGPAALDVRISGCTADNMSAGYALLKADVSYLNNTSRAHTYTVDVLFESPVGLQLASQGVSFVQGLSAGATYIDHVSIRAKANSPAQTFTCKIGHVNRSTENVEDATPYGHD